MLELRKGCKVPFPEMLEEGYKTFGNMIIANVSADKIKAVMAHFICTHPEPIFFILELPANQHDEAEIQPGVVAAFHKDIYYIDGCTTEEALAILSRIGELAINDGLCAFGFGGHKSQDEIMFDKYNVTTIFCKDTSGYDGFLEEHGIVRNDNLVLAWDTFSEDNPGQCETVVTEGRDVYSIPEQFADWGIYKAEQREAD